MVHYQGGATHNRAESYPKVLTQGKSTRNEGKWRDLGNPVAPRKLLFRMPEVSWELAAMAASLMVQQAVPVLRLLTPFAKKRSQQ